MPGKRKRVRNSEEKRGEETERERETREVAEKVFAWVYEKESLLEQEERWGIVFEAMDRVEKEERKKQSDKLEIQFS